LRERLEKGVLQNENEPEDERRDDQCCDVNGYQARFPDEGEKFPAKLLTITRAV
jgi:hypothetical protein